MINCSRRNFLGGAAALFGAGGCRMTGICGDKPQIRFGVISDIHLTDPASAATFERTLRYFDSRKVDAVMVPGDLSDWGLLSGLRYVADAWRRVFPKGRGSDGRKVERLFCTGNHDYEGWWYGDMTMEMHALGYSEDEALVNLGMKKCWEEVFEEPFELFRRRTVNGFEFISSEFEARDSAGRWFEANAATFSKDRPFFYFTHYPAANTVSSTLGRTNLPDIAGVLDKFPNLFAFTGHTHWTLNDERSICQRGYTAVSTPSLSYSTIPRGYENGSDVRNGKSRLSMPRIDSRFNLEEAQGYVVSVYPGRMEIERRDFTHGGVEAAPAWVVPLPVREGEKPFTDARAKTAPVPQFASDATLETYTRNFDRRDGYWMIGMMLDFPCASAVRGARAFDYEVRALLADGSSGMTKRFLSPAFHKLPSDEPKRMLFAVDAEDLPQEVEYRLAVYPRNCFGVCGRPLVAAPRKGKPGKDISKGKAWR